MAKHLVTLGASGVGPGVAQTAQGNEDLTSMAVAMEAHMRAIETWIISSEITALDNHVLKLDTLKAGRAQMGSLTFEGPELAEIVQKVRRREHRSDEAAGRAHAASFRCQRHITKGSC